MRNEIFSYKIDKNVPIPERHGALARYWYEIFKTAQNGDSIVVPTRLAKNLYALAQRKRVSVIIRTANVGMKRVWIIKP